MFGLKICLSTVKIKYCSGVGFLTATKFISSLIRTVSESFFWIKLTIAASTKGLSVRANPFSEIRLSSRMLDISWKLN